MVDKIGRKDIINKINYLIENLPHDNNFCLALNGSWGSGKSVVVELLKEELIRHPEYIVVHYDAWKNNFYSDPLIAMLYCILDTLEQATTKEVADSIKSKKAKKTALTMTAEVGGAIVEAAAEKVKIVGIIKGAIEKIKAVIKDYKATALTNNPEVEEYKSYASFLNQTIAQLNEITAQEFLKDKQTRLIVLVDEIDRCLPNEQLIVLEKLHHLFNVKNCAVIVALNKEAIHKTFEKHYGGNSEDYLRKFFQYNFELPTNAVKLLKNRLIDLFYEVNDKREEALIEKSVDFIISDMIKVVSDLILDSESKTIDNREIEKYANDIGCILKCIVDYHPALLWFALRMYLYHLFNSNLYKRIMDEKNSDLIVLWELRPFYGMKDEPINQAEGTMNFNGTLRHINYCFYPNNNSYNDLLYLFNLCRFRKNQYMLNEFSRRIPNNTFDENKTNELVEKIETVLSEIERYGG